MSIADPLHRIDRLGTPENEAPGGFLPLVNRGELAVVCSVTFLYLVTAGGGPCSLDRLLRHRD